MQDPERPNPFTANEAALAAKALAEQDFDALRPLLSSACGRLLPTKKPRIFAKLLAQQLMIANPNDMLLQGWHPGSLQFSPEHAESLAYALDEAFMGHGIKLDVRQAQDDFLSAPIPHEAVEACSTRLFAPEQGAGAPDHCPEAQQDAVLHYKWHRRFDLLMEQEDLSPRHRHAARAFLAEGNQITLSTPDQLEFLVCLRTLEDLLAENTRHSKLAAGWLAALHDANWGRDKSKALLRKAKALCEAHEIEPAMRPHACASGPKAQTL